MPESLSVRRAADRVRMANELVATLNARRAPYASSHPLFTEDQRTVCAEETRGPREIVVGIYVPGAFCYVDFDGASSQPGTWVVTWNTSRRMAPGSWDVNPYHGCKATRVFYSFADLCNVLAADVERFAIGSAFLEV